MDKKLLYKLLAIGLLTLLLLVPLTMIEGQIYARSARQNQVQANIAETSAGKQTLVGPVLAIRYRELAAPETVKDPVTGQISTVQHKKEYALLLPASRLDIRGQAQVETRSRGIYQARLYHQNLVIKGRFDIPAHLGLPPQTNLIDAQAVLLLGVSDLRGVDNDPEVEANGSKYRFGAPRDKEFSDLLPGAQLQIELGAVNLAAATGIDFAFPLNLSGTESFAIAPTAEANTIEITSDWRHPSFQGRFLPRERSIDASGFKARWEVSHLARDFDASLQANRHGQEMLGINFVDPVNVYLQSERAVKYGSLFIVLTFAAFFLGEILRRRPMHPLQYLLVGLALALFFLLLIALSEHLSFLVSYLASAIACIALITTYLAGALGGNRPALAFGAGYTGLYGVLYGVLLSEDNALLMGAVLLFIALGAIMLSTRKLDWYRLGQTGESA